MVNRGGYLYAIQADDGGTSVTTSGDPTRRAPGGRILFCIIQKVGCTSFKKLLSEHRVHVRAALPNSSPQNTPQRITDSILHNASWHKAMFYREPLERFLSGYLDKCIKEPARVTCRSVFGAANVTFDAAVRSLLTQDPEKLDEHFSSQVDFCGGLLQTLPLFDTVEQLDPHTSREAVGRMLQRANMTSLYFDQLYPPKGYGATGHETGASRSLEEHYGNHQHVGIVVNFFYEDDELLNISLPRFAVDALLVLNRTQDEYRLPSERLDRLLSIGGWKDVREEGAMTSMDASQTSAVIGEHAAGKETDQTSACNTFVYAFSFLALGFTISMFTRQGWRRNRPKAQ